MPRLLFLVNHLVQGVYTCHARIGFASARKQREFLQRERPAETNGWQIAVSSPARQGYDGKPVYQTDIRLSTPYPRAALQTDADRADHPAEIRENHQDYGQEHAQPDGLSWTEQATFQRETTALLDQMGVTGLGWRQGR